MLEKLKHVERRQTKKQVTTVKGKRYLNLEMYMFQCKNKLERIFPIM